MTIPDLIRLRLKALRAGRLGAFGRDEGGATAIELALLAVPFFAMIGAILETALVFLASQVLDSAVQDASRLIRTGQAQTAGFTIDDFRNSVCDKLFSLFNCSNLQIRVTTVTNFASATTPPTPLDPNDPTKWTLVPAFDAGTSLQVIMVQVYYKWPVILNFGGFNLATSSDGTHLLGAVRVFANEPFS
jgi:Flp pilus assembly protein TadG